MGPVSIHQAPTQNTVSLPERATASRVSAVALVWKGGAIYAEVVVWGGKGSALSLRPPPPMVEHAHPCNNNRGQPRTAKDSPEKTPGAPRTLGDEPTDSLQGGGGRGLLPLPNCGDAYEGELAPVPNP